MTRSRDEMFPFLIFFLNLDFFLMKEINDIYVFYFSKSSLELIFWFFFLMFVSEHLLTVIRNKKQTAAISIINLCIL